MNKTAEEIYPYLENEESSIGIREHNQRMYDCRQAYNKGFAAAQFAAPPPASEGEMAEFLKVVTSERNEFCTFINSLLWDSGLRTHCESLLIIYDQMKERLATLPTREPEGWVSDRWPDYMECAIICNEYGSVLEAQYSGIENVFYTGDKEHHAKCWQPLPCPPNQSPIK